MTNRNRRISFMLACLAGIALLAVIARLISRFLGSDFRLAYLACMLAAYAAASAVVAMQRSRLARRVKEMPARQRTMLAAVCPELRYAATSGAKRIVRACCDLGSVSS